MTAIELRRHAAEMRTQAETLHTQAVAEARTLTEDESKTFDGLMDKVEATLRDADRADRLAITGQVAVRSAAQMDPIAPAYHQRRTPDTAEGIYCRFIRSGDVGAQRELRASNNTDMNITTAADGGDLVPTGHYNQIIEKARPQALYTQLGVRMIPGTGTTVNVPVDNEADTGEFVSTNESAAFDRDAPAVSKVALTLVKYTKKVDLTLELLQDEDSRLLDFLGNYVAAGYAATLNKLLITEALANGTAGLTLDSATAIGAAEVPELLYKLNADYARGNTVAWVMKRATEGYLRGLFGTSQFSFAQQAGPATGNGQTISTLWGIPQFSDDNMGALQASGKSMIIGNWNYMGMRLDPTMTVLRDPYSRAGYGEVILHYYFRCDFGVLQAGAFQYATHPTA